MLYFAGWEFEIARSGIDSLLIGAGWNININLSLLLALVLACVMTYTVAIGQKANGIVDTILNIIKIVLITIVVISVGIVLYSQGSLKMELLAPNFSTAIGSIGLIGLYTNLIFNLSWQFVDNSSWQSISSALRTNQGGIKRVLVGASGGVLIAYTLSTILGAALRGIPGLTSDNILGSISSILKGEVGIVITIAAILLLLLAMVSLIDGISLSIAQSLTVDAGLGKLVSMVTHQKTGLRLARIVTIIGAIFAAWGIRIILKMIGGSIFDFIYILIVVQLSLFGSVIVGLMFKSRHITNMWIAIVLGVISGLGASIAGGSLGVSWLVDLAGTIATFVSTIVAVILYLIAPKVVELYNARG
ncbi:MAG: hypothetical protein A2Y24_05920 [Clostridiales bacterium GWE2_32_10]|nr:MAG: hypothetical protein A2Y24_05920 [Clostridiales bacterium GWE2_32_10]